MKILIRADGDEHIGTGHVMRMIALAQAIEAAGGSATFLLAACSPALRARLEEEGVTVETMTEERGSAGDARRTLEVAEHIGASWVVADGYAFDTAYQASIKDSPLRMLLVDDYGHARRYLADLVLNQNLSAEAGWYADRAPDVRLLLGPEYVLLRDEFLAYRDWQRTTRPVAGHVLVTLGGSDPDDVSRRVVEAIDGMPVEVRTVLGGSNPHAATHPSVVRDVRNMPELMTWADIAIAAGGSTTYELAFMGLPAIVLVLADNQRAIAAALDRARIAVDLGDQGGATRGSIAAATRSLLADASRRQAMGRRGRALVDGRGRDRVVAMLAAGPTPTDETPGAVSRGAGAPGAGAPGAGAPGAGRS